MTNDTMAHEDAVNSLEALALDVLDGEERAPLVAHVAGCDICREELAALQASTSELAYLVAPLPMSTEQRERIRGRLLERAVLDRPHAAAHHTTPTSSRILMPHHAADIAQPPQKEHWYRNSTAWMAMAAGLIAVGSVAALVQVTHERDMLQEAYQLASTRSGTVDSLRDALVDRDRLIANLTGPHVAVMSLASAGVKAPSARMFWDQSVDQWTFVAHNMPAPRPGRAYQLWLVTPSAKISAGMFMPGPNGDAMVRATHALAKDALAAVAVTDEPEAGSPQPTTVPLIVATSSTR